MNGNAQQAGIEARIRQLLRQFKLPTMAELLVDKMQQTGHDEALQVIGEVLEAENDDRRQRRVARLRHASKLPAAKTFDNFDTKRLPVDLQRRIRELRNGDFLEQARNVLAFGLPGTGKSHFAVALGQELTDKGFAVLFTPTFRLVQELLVARRDFELPRALRKLDRFDLLILDDIGYVQQSEEEIEVLFTLLAERYERRSLLITSNLVFSEWDKIFRNKLTTLAAVDRLVHHSSILEFAVPSYRSPKSGAPAC